MTSWTIVAIPEESDRVWKVSSEKVPHMTLLFLGEQDDPEKALQITQYLEHTVKTTLIKFGMSVNKRGILGDKLADVLYFEQSVRDSRIKNFRGFLLADPTISECYNSTEQFPQWTPHLTLGYPETPATPIEDLDERYQYPLDYVCFDKIALWVDDYDGPSFDLEYQKYADDFDMSHSAVRANIAMQNALARQQRLAAATPSVIRHSSELPARGYGTEVFNAVVRALPDAALSARRRASEDRFVIHAAVNDELAQASRRKNVRENQSAFQSYLEHRFSRGSKARSTSRIFVSTRPDEDWLVSCVDKLAHTGTVEVKVHPIVNDDGMITDYEISHDDLTQDDIRTALAHVGVKGMKWGVRRSRPDISSAASAAKGKAGDIGKVAAAKGSQLGAAAKARAGAAKGNFDASREAKRVAKAAAPKGDAGLGTDSASKKTREERKADKKAAKKFDRSNIISKPKPSEEAEINAQARKRTQKHGTDLMSNKELQAMVNRMNLEQQYQSLMESEKPRSARAAGKAYVGEIVKQAGQELAVELLKGAVISGSKAAKNQATNSDSRSRNFVSSTQNQISPAMRQILQLPPGRSSN